MTTTSISVILYTHHKLPDLVWQTCFGQFLDSLPDGVQLLLVGEQREPFFCDPLWQPPEPILVPHDDRGAYFDCYGKTLAGLRQARNHTCYLAEHDVLYTADHWTRALDRNAAPNVVWYNSNNWRLNRDGWFRNGRALTSLCCADRDVLIRIFERRMGWLEAGQRIVWDEPGHPQGDGRDDGYDMAYWRGASPCIDVRHGSNLTGYREESQGRYVQDLPPWGKASDWQKAMGMRSEPIR